MKSFAALPPTKPRALDIEQTYADGELVTAMPLGWEDSATTAQTITLKLGDIAWPIRAGERLLRVAAMEGGDLATLPAGAVTYCGPYMTTKSAAQAALLTFGVSAMVSRFDPRVRLCAVDSDADGRFEQGFLVGARSNDDRKLKPIEPVAYTAVKGFPIEGASLTISYATPVAFNPPALQLYLVIPGVYRTTGTYSFPDNLPAPGVKETREERKARDAATPSTHHTSASVSEKSLPQTVTIGNARITIRSVNRQAKTAQISIAREQTFFPFSFKADSQTIHIYI